MKNKVTAVWYNYLNIAFIREYKKDGSNDSFLCHTVYIYTQLYSALGEGGGLGPKVCLFDGLTLCLKNTALCSSH